MHHHCSEIRAEEFLQHFLPGEDPFTKDVGGFYTVPATILTGNVSGKVLNAEICKLAHAVFRKAGKHTRKDHRLAIRDISKSKTTKKITGYDSAVFLDHDCHTEPVPWKRRNPTIASPLTDDKQKFAGRSLHSDLISSIRVEVDHVNSAFEFENPSQRLTREHTKNGLKALGRLEHHIASIFGRQHRTHFLSLYVYRDQARMTFTDRAACIVSEPFKYIGREASPDMYRFFWRLAGLTREQLGFDPTVTPASKEDFDAMYEFATTSMSITPYVQKQLYYALCVDPPTTTSTGSPSMNCHQWPLRRIARPDGTYVLIGRPKHVTPALFGRCTRGYVGFDPSAREAFFTKDSWRGEHSELHSEHLVYKRLQENGVQNIPTCIGGGDVGEDTVFGVQTTRTTSIRFSSSSALGDKDQQSEPTTSSVLVIFARVHYRIFIKQILRPITDFEHFLELVAFFIDVLSAHRDAWVNAGILHRDVSVNNLMIDETPDGAGDVAGGRALLCDWDLCKYREQMNTHQRTATRTGTWYFRSALSQRFPFKPYAVSDDIESFLYVFYYLVFRFEETWQTVNLTELVPALFFTQKIIPGPDGLPVYVGGATKLFFIESGFPPVKTTANHKINMLLARMASLCKAHYASIDLEDLKKDGPNGADELLTPNVSQAQTKGPKRKSTFVLPEGPELVSEDTNESKLALPEPTLDTHDALIALFREFHVRWPKQYLTKSEDLFLLYRLVLPANNAFSVESNDPGFIPSIEPRKKRKMSDGSTLEVVADKGDAGDSYENDEDEVE